MRNKFLTFIKNSWFFYRLYYFFLSGVLNLLKIFVRPDDHLILFVAFGGRFFNDSPRVIYDSMVIDPRFKNYKLIWAFTNKKKFPDIKSVKIDTFKYFLVALKARVWITNVSVERGLGFKGKKTFYFHTTHGGMVPKLIGNDIKKGTSFTSLHKFQFDCSCAQGEEEIPYEVSAFNLRPEQVLLSGYPKNDILTRASPNDRNRFLSSLGIPVDKIVILYAPTYREDNKAEMATPVNFLKWRSILGNNYVVLFRSHPVVNDINNFDKSLEGFLYNVTDVQDNNIVLMASDILISDYSGIFFEYGVLHRPMYCYAYDYDNYIKTRGLYFDIRDELPGGHLNETELLNELKKPSDETQRKNEAFISKWIKYSGRATQICLDKIYETIKGKK